MIHNRLKAINAVFTRRRHPASPVPAGESAPATVLRFVLRLGAEYRRLCRFSVHHGKPALPVRRKTHSVAVKMCLGFLTGTQRAELPALQRWQFSTLSSTSRTVSRSATARMSSPLLSSSVRRNRLSGSVSLPASRSRIALRQISPVSCCQVASSMCFAV